jgi:hypothetical protein
VRLLPNPPQGGQIDWFNASSWQPSGVPKSTDDVVIAALPCVSGLSSIEPWFLLVRNGAVATARSVRFECSGNCTPNCNTVVVLQDGATLAVTGSVSLSFYWAFVALGQGAVLRAGGNVTVTSGVLQGFGTVNATLFAASGTDSHIAPGRNVAGSCGSCMPGWASVHDLDVTGVLTIVAPLATIGGGATVWIKHNPPAPTDRLMVTGQLALRGAFILQFPPDVVSAESTVFFSSLAAKSSWTVDVYASSLFPWAKNNCACLECGPGGCDSVLPPGLDSTGPCGAMGPISIVTGLGFGGCVATAPPLPPPPVAVTCATMTPTCVHGTCFDVQGQGPVCSCPSDSRGFGLTGTLCDQLFCGSSCGGAAQGSCVLTAPDMVPHCVCSSAWQGETCVQPRCVPPCATNGACVAAGGGVAVCNCAPGWQGTTCATPLAANTCPDCNGRGNCSAATNFACNCTLGYSGSSCGIASCPGLGCSGNGVCRPAFPPLCECAPQWSGSACATRQCVSDDCLNGAQCSVSANQPTCSCADGWTGSQCQLVAFSANGTATTTPGADSIVGLAVGVAVGVAAAGVLVALAIWLIHRHRMASETLSINKDLAKNSLVELERHKATGNFE